VWISTNHFYSSLIHVITRNHRVTKHYSATRQIRFPCIAANDKCDRSSSKHAAVEKNTICNRAVLLPVVNPECNYGVLEIAEQHPGRFIPFFNVDPRSVTNSAENKRCRERYALKTSKKSGKHIISIKLFKNRQILKPHGTDMMFAS
jgi:hypothetical protein